MIVDEQGNVITKAASAPTPAPQPVNPIPLVPAAASAAPSPLPQNPPPAAQPAAPPAPPAQPAAAPPAAEAPPAEAPPAPAVPSTQVLSTDDGFIDSGPSAYGLSWSGYKGGEGNSACKTMDDADNEWSQMGSYGIVRTYGTDCDQPNIAFQMAKKYNKKLFLGAYHLDASLPAQVQTIINAARASGGWSRVDTISIGNEDVHRGEKTPAQIFASVGIAKAQLRLAGYHGPVVHVDSQDAILAHPSLCSHLAGDYIAANIHAFFNPETTADQAGDFVANQVNLLQQCGTANHKGAKNVRVRVTETGWPKNGQKNGVAVPSKSNQNAAVASIKRKFANDLFFFSAFNNYWMKNDASTFDTEHYWGMLDN